MDTSAPGFRVPQQRSRPAVRGSQVLAAMSSEQVRAGPPGSRVPGSRARRSADSGSRGPTRPLRFPSQPLGLAVTVTAEHSSLGRTSCKQLDSDPSCSPGVFVARGRTGCQRGLGLLKYVTFCKPLSLFLSKETETRFLPHPLPPQAGLGFALQARLALNLQHFLVPSLCQLRSQATQGSHLVLWCVIKDVGHNSL